jgi:calcineurin-like phosphoesterase family protein
MFYYIFRVKTNKPDIVPDYYILNNCYIGYIGHDSNSLRHLLEYHAKIKNRYQLIAMGEVENDEELHKLNCDSERMDAKQINHIIEKYDFIEHDDDRLYIEYYPIKNCSKTLLKSVDNSRIILDDGLIVTTEDFKKNRKTYLK